MRRFILPLAFSLTWIGQTCLADLVQFEIQGTLSAISGLSPSPANAPAIGSPFVGTYLFDTSAMDTSDPPSFGTYHTPVPPSFVSLKVGDWEWQQTGESPTTIVVGNDLAAGGGGTEDAYSAGNSRIRLFTPDDPNAGMAEYWLFQWDLHGGASIFSNTALASAGILTGALDHQSVVDFAVGNASGAAIGVFRERNVVHQHRRTGAIDVGTAYCGTSRYRHYRHIEPERCKAPKPLRGYRTRVEAGLRFAIASEVVLHD